MKEFAEMSYLIRSPQEVDASLAMDGAKGNENRLSLNFKACLAR
jgi:hypothetical protein